MSVYGIDVRKDAIIRDNIVSGNTAQYSAYGIYVFGDGCRIENNNCSRNVGTDSGGYGIIVMTGIDDCVVLRNHTRENSMAGIALSTGTHYCAENMTAETTGIMGGSNSLLENNKAIP